MKTVASETNEATFTAQDYAELGFAPIRLYGVNPDGSCGCGGGEKCVKARRVGKHPIGSGWQNAPIVAKAVDRHIARGGNVGLRMGDQPSGARYVALDEDAEGALAKGEELWGPLPETLTSRTGSGGRHCIYEWPADKPYPSNKVRSNGLKFDVRGQDSQIVAAPSRNANGPYSWTRFDVPAALPATWVAALLADSGKRTGPRKAGKMPHVAIADPDARTAALVEALAPFWEAPGEAIGRRHRLRALGGYLARRGWPDEQIAALVRALPTERPESERVSLAIECAQQARSGDDSAAGWTNLEEWSPDAAAVIESIAKDPREPEGFQGVWAPCLARMFERAARATASNDVQPDPMRTAGKSAADTAEFSGPYILQNVQHSDTILLWRGADKGHQPVAMGSLRLVIKKSGLDKKIPLSAKVESDDAEQKPKKVKLPASALVERWAEPFDHTVYDFALRVSEYEPQHSRVIVGYPNVRNVGKFDADVDAWLRAMAGDAYERLAAWIASCAQRHIDRLAAALVFTGPADVGKSLFSCAIAGLWGAAAPPAALLLVKQFNGELTKCAIVCDEEAQLFGTKALSTKRFRDLTQSTERSIELKGLESFTLRGALRVIVPCNEISDLRFKDLTGPDIVKAVIDRLCIIDTKPRAAECKAALSRLRLPNTHRVDIGRVTGHMAWLCETVAIPAERFIGAGGGSGGVLAGHVEEHSDLWETFRDWLESDAEGGAWSAHRGQLCAEPKALAVALERTGKGWDLPRVRTAALAPFKVRNYQPDADDTGARPRLWVLDWQRISDALGLDTEARTALAAKLKASVPPAQPRKAGRFEG